MMKKKGFTLAEILITLTIIGVVAVLTMPALMSNTKEAQARAGIKKMMNTLTNAAALASAGSVGYDFDGVTVASGQGATGTTLNAYLNDTGNIAEKSLALLLSETTGLDLSKDTVPKSVADGGYTLPTNSDTAFYFKDGTAIYFKHDMKSTDNGTASDGNSNGLFVYFDYNGSKGPNEVSYCQTKPTTQSWTSDDGTSCQKKSDRHIEDIFMMKLRGNSVVPLGSASAWMYDEKTYISPEISEGASS